MIFNCYVLHRVHSSCQLPTIYYLLSLSSHSLIDYAVHPSTQLYENSKMYRHYDALILNYIHIDHQFIHSIQPETRSLSAIHIQSKRGITRRKYWSRERETSRVCKRLRSKRGWRSYTYPGKTERNISCK